MAASKLTYTCASDIGNSSSLPVAGSGGAGCTSEDPKLDASSARRYRLTSASSACVDKGVATAASSAAGAIDLLGNPRTLYDEVDMGCFEFQKKMYVAKDGGSVFPYDTWAKAATDLKVPLATDTTEIEVGDGNFTNTVLRHVVDRPMRIYSSNGPTATTLTATGGHFKVTAEALIAGFTLRNTGVFNFKVDGVNERTPIDLAAGIVSNCIVTGVLKKHHYASIVRLMGTAQAVDCDFDGSALSLSDAAGSDSSWGMLRLDGSSLADRCRIHDWKVTWAPASKVDYSHCAVIITGSDAVLRNSLVYSNSFGWATASHTGDTYCGGGVRMDDGLMENCTVVGNRSGGKGGGVFARKQAARIRNCIIWGNTAYGQGQDLYAGELPAVNLTYTCASDIGNAESLPVAISGGGGCINADPRFVEKFGEAYYLRSNSPCVDAGTSVGYPDIASAIDLRHQPRLYGSAVDMGCFEVGPRSGMCLIFR